MSCHLVKNGTGATAWFRCADEECGFVWLGHSAGPKNRRAQAVEMHSRYRNALVARAEMAARADQYRD